jgi:hypothetical protein
MRSLWRFMAAQWLGGAGSEVLTGDSALADLLLPEQTAPAFRVARSREPRLPAITAPPMPGAVARAESDHPAGRRG